MKYQKSKDRRVKVIQSAICESCKNSLAQCEVDVDISTFRLLKSEDTISLPGIRVPVCKACLAYEIEHPF